MTAEPISAPPPPLSVGIINYNGIEAGVEGTLNSILQSAYPFFEVIVVDDCSTDGSAEYIRKRFPQVRVIEQPRNMGLNAGRNRALREAKHELVFLADNDAFFDHGMLRLLVEAISSDPSAAMATPMILDSEQRDKIYSNLISLHYVCFGIIPFRGRTIPADLDLSVKKSVCGAGGFMLARKSIAEKLGWFDEDLRFGYDEGEYAFRASACGYTVLQVPKAKVFHIEKSVRNKSRLRFPVRNRWDFMLKTYSTRTLVLISPALLLFETANLGFFIIKGALFEWLRGMRMAQKSLGRIMEKRRAFLAMKKLPDKDLLATGEIFVFPSKLGGGPMNTIKRVFEIVFDGYWRLISPFLTK